MSNPLIPPGLSVDSFSGVAEAVARLDEFYGQLAAIPYMAPIFIRNCVWDSTWYGLWVVGQQWYGVGMQPGTPSYRAQSLDSLFALFEPEATQNNFVAPLAKLDGEAAGLKAGGLQNSSLDVVNMRSQLAEIVAWLRDGLADATTSYKWLAQFVDNVHQIDVRLKTDLGSYILWPDGNDKAIVIDQAKQIIGMTEELGEPTEAILTAFTSQTKLASQIADRLSGAMDKDPGSALQELAINSSLDEWAKICRQALRYRPGPPPSIPSSPLALLY